MVAPALRVICQRLANAAGALPATQAPVSQRPLPKAGGSGSPVTAAAAQLLPSGGWRQCPAHEDKPFKGHLGATTSCYSIALYNLKRIADR